MNFVPVTVEIANGTLRLVHESFVVDAPRVDAPLLTDGAPASVGIRPEDIQITVEGEGVPATVYATEPLGGETVVDVTIGDRIVKALAPPTLVLAPDDAVRITFDPQRLHVFDQAGDAALSAAGAGGMFQVHAFAG